jgi:hypothetical protein
VIKEAVGVDQYGVGMSGGAELACNVLRIMAEVCHTHDKDWGIIKIDAENAFNKMSRFAMSEALYSNPQLSPLWHLFKQAYGGKPPVMLLHDHRTRNFIAGIEEGTGAIQGDGLASFLYCLGQNQATKKTRTLFPKVTIIGDMDDANLIGPTEEIFKAYKHLSEHREKICNVTTNSRKSAVMYCGKSEPPDRMKQLCIEHNLPAPTKKLVTLGACISLDDDAALHAHVQEQLSDTAEMLAELDHPLISTQNKCTLLRYCILPKAQYISRVTKPSATTQAFIDFDDKLINASCDAIGLVGDEKRDKRTREQLGLSLKKGGMGIRPLTNCTHNAAWFAAHAEYSSHITEMREKVVQAAEIQPADLQQIPTDIELKRVGAELVKQGVKFDDHFPNQNRVDFWTFYNKPKEKPLKKIQHHLTEQIDQHRADKLIREAAQSGDKEDVARLLSLASSRTCYQPLIANANDDVELKIEDKAMQIYGRMRVGKQPVRASPSKCRCGKDHDQHGLHAQRCKMSAGFWTGCHDQMVGTIMRMAKKKGKLVAHEPSQWQKEHHVRPDLLITDEKGALIVDVSLTTSDPNVYCNGSEPRGKEGIARAANKREHEKQKKYDTLSKQHNLSFYPFTMERNTLAMGDTASVFLKRIYGVEAEMAKAVIAANMVRANAALAIHIATSDLFEQLKFTRMQHGA